jgi:hypothetical protein
MVPVISYLISSGSKKEEPRYVCLSEAKASLRPKILITSGTKKGNQIDYSFLSKVPANEPHTRFPKRAPVEREASLPGILHIPLKVIFRVPR